MLFMNYNTLIENNYGFADEKKFKPKLIIKKIKQCKINDPKTNSRFKK
jgi:hypothetical protein